jgi:hypothetical protein
LGSGDVARQVRLQVSIGGPAVAKGTIDAHSFADSLAGYSEVFKRVNYVVNGEGSEAAVLVQANFKAGSFVAELQFIQELSLQASQFLHPHPIFSAAELAALIGLIWKNKDSLFELFRWLKGRRPEKVVQTGNSVEVTFGQNKKTVTNITFQCFGDSAVKAAISKLVSPLKAHAIDRISVKQDGVEQTSIDKTEVPYFEPESTALELPALATEGHREAVLVVSKLSFKEGSTWTFFERGATVVAKIQDEEFWAQVHEHKITFGEGDMLRVDLSWKIEQQRKLVQKNVITKVYEVLPRPRQMRLDGAPDDEVR